MQTGTEEDIFLSEAQVAKLTARKLKSLQIEQLRIMGIQFYINAAGRPVVPKSAISGSGAADEHKPKKKWQPNLTAR